MPDPEQQIEQVEQPTPDKTTTETVEPNLSAIQGIRKSVKDYIAGIDWKMMPPDMIARATYSITTGAIIETIAGMEFNEIVLSRAVALPITTATSRFYGKFRDWPLNKYEINKQDDRAKFIASNMLTYLVFYCTQYAAIRYYVVGASAEETAVATTELFALSFPLGAAYGYWLDFFRHKIFRIPIPPKDQTPP